ncbi:MAG: outer membrane lipid asymmetry maintenance protein MlaD [Deltaproteobacteria bacterium]|nr:MAG: outer membrane lipid asymmetry maintenance protein MlaD [Deltaproteobacteria bacterium]
MERKGVTEFLVGIFLLLGMISLAYLSLSLGEVTVFGKSKYYQVSAVFSSIAGLKKDAVVSMAGVEIGRVIDISLTEDKEALVRMRIRRNIKLEEDSIASIKTMGIIGDKYIMISPGASDEVIPPGGRIMETEPPLDLEELIGKYIFGKVK